MKLARSMPPWLWLLLVVLYFLSPVDIFPDFLGLPGRVDDFLVALAGLYFMYANSPKRRTPGSPTAGTGQREPGAGRETRDPAGGGGDASRQREPGPLDPYEVLGVPLGTPFPDIRRRYRERLLEVHPDRVQHLGEEFQEIAERKTRELNGAFRKIEQELKKQA